MKKGLTLIEVLAVLTVTLLLGIFMVLLFSCSQAPNPPPQSGIVPQAAVDLQQHAPVKEERSASRPSQGSFRSRGWRANCANNLKGLGIGFYTYANENLDAWPIAAHAVAQKDQEGRVAYAPGKIGVMRGDGKDPMSGESNVNSTELSTTRNMWMLIRIGASAPKSFICPESREVPNNEDNPQVMWDFKQVREVSYGYQVPYGKFGQPSSDRDQRMPLSADRGAIGAALEAGIPSPSLLSNSPNHNSEGQNVLFADSHVEFVSSPSVGVFKDNIYTRWSDEKAGDDVNQDARTQGTAPTGRETPWSNTDSLIYP